MKSGGYMPKPMAGKIRSETAQRNICRTSSATQRSKNKISALPENMTATSLVQLGLRHGFRRLRYFSDRYWREAEKRGGTSLIVPLL
jgi:hypothetical protein